jgi:hypothetical protein
MLCPTLFLGATYAATLFTSAYASAAEPIDGFHVIWSDDFSGSGGFDTSKWQHYKGQISNGEQETYPASGDYCKLSGQGSLLITPKNDNGQWASCRIETTEFFTPPAGGKLIVQSRFKLGTPGVNLQGIWPAFWSLGQSMREGTPWPQCGEIDTFENVSGGQLGYGTLHCGTTCNGNSGLSQGTTFSYGDFHTWAHAIDLSSGDVSQQSITFYMDGQAYHVVHGSDLAPEDWSALTKATYMTLNVAVGGGWPGPVSPRTASGQDAGMEVLYVAVYQSN